MGFAEGMQKPCRMALLGGFTISDSRLSIPSLKLEGLDFTFSVKGAKLPKEEEEKWSQAVER
jgi:hypothetical protein